MSWTVPGSADPGPGRVPPRRPGGTLGWTVRGAASTAVGTGHELPDLGSGERARDPGLFREGLPTSTPGRLGCQVARVIDPGPVLLPERGQGPRQEAGGLFPAAERIRGQVPTPRLEGAD